MYEGSLLAEWFRGHLIDNVCRELAEKAGERTTARVKEKTPVGHDPFRDNYIPGELRASITKKILVVRPSPRGMVYESGAETFVDYAPYVEDGTGLWGPHHAKYAITPKHPDGWLRFHNKAGELIFAKKVMHPGSPGAHMFAIGVAMAEHEFKEFSQKILERWAREQERNRSHVVIRGKV